MSLTILGVDPGSRVTGFGILRVERGQIFHVNHGVILLPEKSPFTERVLELGQAFREVLAKYQPDHVVIEKIFLGKNADSAFKLGHARGVIMYESCLQKAKIFEYATRVVKKSVTGNGGSQKEEVQTVLKMLLKVQQIQRMDASDALAMAYHHAMENKKKKLIEGALEI
ncbi:MAG: crossover junction endodeoxyribonuclease RuvC [Bdellovibrionia bacterium]